MSFMERLHDQLVQASRELAEAEAAQAAARRRRRRRAGRRGVLLVAMVGASFSGGAIAATELSDPAELHIREVVPKSTWGRHWLVTTLHLDLDKARVVRRDDHGVVAILHDKGITCRLVNTGRDVCAWDRDRERGRGLQIGFDCRRAPRLTEIRGLTPSGTTSVRVYDARGRRVDASVQDGFVLMRDPRLSGVPTRIEFLDYAGELLMANHAPIGRGSACPGPRPQRRG